MQVKKMTMTYEECLDQFLNNKEYEDTGIQYGIDNRCLININARALKAAGLKAVYEKDEEGKRIWCSLKTDKENYELYTGVLFQFNSITIVQDDVIIDVLITL